MKKRRICAFLMTAVLAFSELFSTAAFAAGDENADRSTTVYEEAVSDDKAEESGDIIVSEASTEEESASDNEAVSGNGADGNVAVSENEAAEDGSISDNDADRDESASENMICSTLGEYSLYIKVPTIMYGEDGSNADGNLDAIFAPVLYKGDYELIPYSEDTAGDYELFYRFFNADVKLNSDNFYEAQALELSDIHAGTEVKAAVLAEPSDDDAEPILACCNIVIAKRKINIYFEGYEGFFIDEREADENGIISISENVAAAGHYCTQLADTYGSVFVKDLPMPAELINEEAPLIFMLPEEGVLCDGEAEFEMQPEYMDEISEDFEIVGNIFGDVIAKKAHYYLFFSCGNNGRREQISVEIARETSAKAIADILSAADMSEKVANMNGLVDGNDSMIAGWMLNVDGYTGDTDPLMLDADFNYGDEEYSVSWGMDYYLSACIAKHAGDRLYIIAVQEVYYCGKSHVSLSEPASDSKQNDLVIGVYTSASDDINNVYAGNNLELVYGKDYTIKYKNNMNASMKINEESGEYMPLYGSNDSLRPCAVISGKGAYAGFSAMVYFEIIPIGLGVQNEGGYASGSTGYVECAQIKGLKDSYALKNGKLSSKINPVVTKVIFDGKPGTYPNYQYKTYQKKLTLKAGVDYAAEVYKWNADGYWELQAGLNGDPNKITSAGDYLYLIRGKGNFCGSLYGEWEFDGFDDGMESGDPVPAHFEFKGTTYNDSYQFRVTNGDAYWDLSNAKVVIGKKAVAWNGNYHDKEDFKLKVTIGKGADKRELREGVDYRLTFKSDPYSYLGKDSQTGIVYVYHGKTDISSSYSELSHARVKTANQYSIRIEAMPDSSYYGTITPKAKVRVKGISLKPSFFNSTASSHAFNGQNSDWRWHLTPAGKRAGLRAGGSYNSSNTYADGTVGCYSLVNKVSPGTYTASLYAMGDNVDHSRDCTKKMMTVKNASLQYLVDKGYVSFEFSSNGYNVKGTYPKITIRYRTASNNNGKYTYSYSTNTIDTMVYNNYQTYITVAVGTENYSCAWLNMYLTFNCRNNTKAGGTAYVKVSAKGKGVKGSSTKSSMGSRYSYVINPEVINDDQVIPALTDDMFMVIDGKKSNYLPSWRGCNRLFSSVEDGLAGDRVNKHVKIYQTYYKNKNDYYNSRLSVAEVREGQYAIETETENANRYRIRLVSAANPIIAGFDIKDNVHLQQYYNIYDEKAVISSVRIRYKDSEYDFSAKEIPEFAFEGGQIRFDRNISDGIISVTLANGTVLGADDCDLSYGLNCASGKKSGSITVKLKYNDNTKTFKYGGSGTFKFDIGPGKQDTTL